MTDNFIITSAINDVPLFEPFWRSIVQYAKKNKAEIIVIPQLYKNPTSQQENMNDDPQWPSEVLPFCSSRRVRLGKNIVMLGDIPIGATAQNPLSGLDTYSGTDSAIVGHGRIQLQTVATRQGRLPKILTSTGSVSKAQYSKSKAGAKARFHHVNGAVVCSVRGSTFHIRQVNACSDGSFIDLFTEYSPTGTNDAGNASGIILGDSHWRWQDPSVTKSTFVGRNSIIGRLGPSVVVHHDTLDFHAQNHHNIDDEFITWRNLHSRINDVRGELDFTIAELNKYCGKLNNVIVASNHDEAFDKWLLYANIKRDPQNALLYYEMKTLMLKDMQDGKSRSALQTYASNKLRGKFRFLNRDESFSVKGIELAFHGDKGINGARGSRKSFCKIGTKCVIGHSHSPGIDQGVYQTGTSTFLKLGYNVGPSSWLNTHCVIYRNGKRSLINIIDGEWH